MTIALSIENCASLLFGLKSEANTRFERYLSCSMQLRQSCYHERCVLSLPSEAAQAP